MYAGRMSVCGSMAKKQPLLKRLKMTYTQLKTIGFFEQMIPYQPILSLTKNVFFLK